MFLSNSLQKIVEYEKVPHQMFSIYLIKFEKYQSFLKNLLSSDIKCHNLGQKKKISFVPFVSSQGHKSVFCIVLHINDKLPKGTNTSIYL